MFISFIETCHSWQPYLKRIDAPVLTCPGMAKQKVGNPNYNTRNRSKYIPKLYFNSLCQQSISYRGPMFWNKVPNSLKKNNQSLGSFYKNLHKFACKYTE